MENSKSLKVITVGIPLIPFVELNPSLHFLLYDLLNKLKIQGLKRFFLCDFLYLIPI